MFVEIDMDRSKQTKVDRLLSEYPDLPLALSDASQPRAGWRPAADLYRCEQGWLVKLTTSSTYPVLPLRGDVLFPFQTMPLSAGRPSSIAALQAALESEDKTLVIASQKNAEAEEPKFGDLFPVGTLAVIRRMGRTDDMIHVIVHGASRVQLIRAANQASYLKAEVSVLPDRRTDCPACVLWTRHGTFHSSCRTIIARCSVSALSTPAHARL